MSGNDDLWLFGCDQQKRSTLMDDIDALVEWQLAGKPTDFHVCGECAAHWSGDGGFCPSCDLAQ